MARETDKSARKEVTSSEGAGKNRQSSKTNESEESGSVKGTSQAAKGSEGEISCSDFQRNQISWLKSVLDKRTQDKMDAAAIVREFACSWIPAVVADMELLGPVRRQANGGAEVSPSLGVRRDIVNILLSDLLDNEIFDDGAPEQVSKAKLDALSDAIDDLAQVLEQDQEAWAKQAGEADQGKNLGQRLSERFEYLKRHLSDIDRNPGEVMDLLAPRSLSVFPSRQRSREPQMARYSSSTPDRDERGRFVSDDDRGYSRGRRGGPDRDEYGRFEARDSRGRSDDDDRYGRRTMSRSRDDDEYFRSSEGHSEASRRGWDNPRHGESGWYGDSEGHSEASRRGWDNPRHGESGWYGDPEGHSEASRRGWEGRSSASRYRDEDERYYRSRGGNGGRGRYEDDDRHSSRGRGHGGWSGDPEGHSEAARRGWDHRR